MNGETNNTRGAGQGGLSNLSPHDVEPTSLVQSHPPIATLSDDDSDASETLFDGEGMEEGIETSDGGFDEVVDDFDDGYDADDEWEGRDEGEDKEDWEIGGTMANKLVDEPYEAEALQNIAVEMED